MDTKKLVVGHQVVMHNGRYLAGLGTIIKTVPEGVIVRIDLATGPMPDNSLVRFDTNGKVCDSKDLGYSGPENNGLPCSFECRDPWELTEDSVAIFFKANKR